MLGIFLTGCYSIISKSNNLLVINSIENTNREGGRYRILFDNSGLVLFTDSLYSVGDTLLISKK